MIMINDIMVCSFVVTGRYYNSTKRFKKTFEGTNSGYNQANMINLWNGSVWAVNTTGGRKRIKQVIN